MGVLRHARVAAIDRRSDRDSAKSFEHPAPRSRNLLHYVSITRSMVKRPSLTTLNPSNRRPEIGAKVDLNHKRLLKLARKVFDVSTDAQCLNSPNSRASFSGMEQWSPIVR